MARALHGGIGKGVGRLSACVSDMFAGMRIGGRGALQQTACRAPRLPSFMPAGLASPVTRMVFASGPMGRGATKSLQLAGSPTAGLVAAMRSGAGLVSAQQKFRGISSTAPRATGLNDFFVSFPDVDKDGKPMYPAVGVLRGFPLLIQCTLSFIRHASHSARLSRARLDGSRAATEVFR